MKSLILFTLVIALFACAKSKDDNPNISGIDQLTGEWQWVSTCGGIVENCTYSSDTNYAVIDFGSNGKFVELHNGTVYMEADYIVVKTSETSARLRYSSQKYESALSIVNNHLAISRGELVDTYKKINLKLSHRDTQHQLPLFHFYQLIQLVLEPIFLI